MKLLAKMLECMTRAGQSQEERINELCRGVSVAFATPSSAEARLRNLVTVAKCDGLVASKLRIGIMIGFPLHSPTPGRAAGIIKEEGGTLMDERGSTSVEEKIDVVLREIGFAVLAKMGQHRFPPAMMDTLSGRQRSMLNESDRGTTREISRAELDYPALIDTLGHVSDAKIRAGLSADQLSQLETEARRLRGEQS
jgi:hypothetical protein